jgi:hypothetical protein
MVRALSLTMTIFLVCGEPTRADSRPELGANAALKYWQAFATMPKFSDAEQKLLLEECLTMPLDARAQKLVTDSEYSLRLMHRGATVRQCDWGIGWKEDGVEVRLPQMTAARLLTTLACLRARLAVEGGRTQEATDDAIAALILSRQISVDGSLIGVLVGYATEARIYEALALYLPKLNANALKDLQTRLSSLPAGGRPAIALGVCEQNTVEWIRGKVKAVKDKEELFTLLINLAFVGGEGQDRTAKTRALIDECGGTPAGFLKYLDDMEPAYAQLAPKLDLPFDQAGKEIESASKERAANPVFKSLFPSLVHCRQAQARADIRRALFAAAIDIQLNGHDALKNHPDPVAGVPFEMTPFEGGFELRSTWKQPSKPIALAIGRRSN